MSKQMPSIALVLVGAAAGVAATLFVMRPDVIGLDTKTGPSTVFGTPAAGGDVTGLTAQPANEGAPAPSAESNVGLGRVAGSTGGATGPVSALDVWLHDVRELVRRCDPDRNVFRSEKTLVRFRYELSLKPNGDQQYQKLLPEKDSFVYIVDQALREMYFTPAQISVQLVTEIGEKEELYRLYSVAEGPWSGEGADSLFRICAAPVGSSPIDEPEAKSVFLKPSELTCPMFGVFVQVRGEQSDQEAFDRWADTRRQRLLAVIASAVEGESQPSSLTVICRPRVWSSRQQSWISLIR